MRLLAEESLCLVVDVQEKLVPVLPDHTVLLAHLVRLINGLGLLEVPFVLSEQYPQGLGPTLPMIRERLPGVEPWPKVSFSCCDDPALAEVLLGSGRKNILLCGIEAHVCVLQTAIDLVELDFQPVVVVDAVASRNSADAQWALRRLEAEGVLVATVESLLFELTRAAGTDRFKAISRLVK